MIVVARRGPLEWPYESHGFFDPLLAWVDRLTKEGFVQARHRDLVLTADAVPDLFARLARRRPDVR